MLVSFLFLITACQKKKDNAEYKNEVTVILANLDSSTLGNINKEKIIDTLYQYLLKYENDSINRNFYFKTANSYFAIDKYDKYLRVVKKVNNLAIKDKDTVHIAKSLYFFGDFYEEKSQLDSAFSYYSQSEKLYKRIKDTLNTGKTTLYKAGILFDAGNFTESEIETVNALRLLSKVNNTRLIYESYNLLALSLKELNNCKKSLEYFDLTLKQLEQLERENYPKEKIVKSRISCFNNMGRVYEKLKNYQEAIHLYNKGLQTKDLKKIIRNHTQCYWIILGIQK